MRIRWMILLVTATMFCNAQQKLTLQEAISLALQNNFDIRLATNEVNIAEINNNYGLAGGLPSVNGTVTDQEQLQNIRQETPNQAPRLATDALGNTLNANVLASMTLFNGMRVIATKKRLETLQKQSKEELAVQIQNTIAQVMVSYYDIIRQQSYIKTIEKSIQASDTRLQLIENRQKVGMSTTSDLYQSQVDLNNLRQNAVSQQLIYTQAQEDLYALINMTGTGMYVFNDTILPDQNLLLPSILNAIAQNPEVVSAGLQVQISEQIVKETAAQRYPSLRLNAGFSYNRAQSSGGFFLLNQTYGPFVGATLNMPIYNGDIFRRQQQVAKVNAKSAGLQKEALERKNYTGVQKMWQAYNAAMQQLNTARENYILAAKLLDLVMKRFELHQSTIIDVKLAQQSFENAGYLVVNLSFAAKTAEIELKRISNGLVRSN